MVPSAERGYSVKRGGSRSGNHVEVSVGLVDGQRNRRRGQGDGVLRLSARRWLRWRSAPRFCWSRWRHRDGSSPRSRPWTRGPLRRGDGGRSRAQRAGLGVRRRRSGSARRSRPGAGRIGHKNIVDGDKLAGSQERGHQKADRRETRKSWLGLLNFMRFLRRGPSDSGPRKTRLGCPVGHCKSPLRGVATGSVSEPGELPALYGCTPAPVPSCGIAATAVGWSLAAKGEILRVEKRAVGCAQLKAGDVLPRKLAV